MLLHKQGFSFGPFRLQPFDSLLLRGEKPVSLPPKAFDTLVYLAQNSGRLVTRDELIKAIWPDSFVEDGNLSVNISLLRRALGQMEDGESYIETVPKKGYRFRPAVAQEEKTEPLAPREPALPSLQEPPSHRRFWKGAAAIIVVALLVAAGWTIYTRAKSSQTTALFSSMKISRLTAGTDVADAALSPDGKYIAYFLNEDSGQSLWIRQIGAPGDVRILAPEAGAHSGLTFSPAGNYLYYTAVREDGSRTLYRMPSLGGIAAKVLNGITSPISFSSDGKQLAFIRMDPERWEASLMIANDDGSALREIAHRKRPAYFSLTGLAWMPDGRSIACFAGSATDYVGQAFRVVRIGIADGKETMVTERGWAWAGSIVSSAATDVLLVSASEQIEDALQIWMVSLPSGAVSRVTNDLSNYAKLSLTADGKTLAAVESDQTATLWTAPANDADRATPALPAEIHGLRSIAWTADGGIVYSARAGDYFGIFSLNVASRHFNQIAAQPVNKTELAITPDGRYLLYQSEGKIWRADRDGANQRQLTHGAHDVHPASSPDGESVVYASFANWTPAIGGKPTLWRVPINGGAPVQLTTFPTSLPQVSPDGKWIACIYFSGEDPRFSQAKIAVFPFSGGEPVKIFNRPPSSEGAVYWAPDGAALDYIVTNRGVGNIWRQPLNGNAAAPVTHFNSGDLFDFAWSSDGRRLAFARGRTGNDVVLINSSE